jgi:Protein kinase domain
MSGHAGPLMLPVGGSFAAYEVQRRLAVGGMGEVYLCRHRMLNRLDAVKVLRPHLAKDAAFRGRFLREALSVARVRHPSVVQVYTADEADGLLYLAMEYLPGDDLAEVLHRDGRLPADRVVSLLRPVADALDAAHRAHLVHRDVKPRNLIVTGRIAVTLVDFGISRLLDEDSQITRTGEIVGTIAYCSPEQLSRRPVTGACDQYSLGCVAYECLTGEVPFPREGQLAIMTAHVTAPPPRVTAARPDLAPAMDAVLARAMAKDPAARFASCTEFIEALAAAATGGGSRQHPVFVDSAALADGIRAGTPLQRRPGSMALRVGWRPAPAPAPLVVDLGDGPLAVRATPTVAAGVVRWLLAQAVTAYPMRELCVVGALAAAPDENWLWLNWLPHARPGAPPVAGPHVATSQEGAGDLLRRLGEVADDRVRGATGARVLAVLDGLLGARPADLADTARFGIYAVLVLPPDAPVPFGMSTLDLAADGARCRLSTAGEPLAEGELESVPAAYVRELADLLPDA